MSVPKTIRIKGIPDGELARLLAELGLGLKPEEARRVTEILGRDPTIVECFIFDIEWSEHCSYKSSRETLKRLPVTGPHVMVGVGEDAGIVELDVVDGRRYGVTIAHESHNHPSQLLPVEGAATGIGGIVRDVDCMGATVVGVADPLRFGDPDGAESERTRWIASGVVQGIAEYGNALGVPNLGGDVFFDPCFDDNCLVNVVAIGVCAEDEIVHSSVPKGGGKAGYDLILVGKPTDFTGFGGATFASVVIDEEKEEERKGAVQVHDPFIKNVLIMRKANHAVRARARELGHVIGMKDLGAGGIACATSEICDAGGCGAAIDLDAVPVAFDDLPSEVIACAETQERFIWAVPKEFTPEVLRIYNEDWELPRIYEGARAAVIGKATSDGRYILRRGGQVVCDAPIEDVTRGIKYKRASRAPKRSFAEPSGRADGRRLGDALLKVLSLPSVGSKEHIFRGYDTEVQGGAVIRPGEADAGVIAPLLEVGSRAAVALSVDGNPLYGRLDPYWCGACAVAEAMRNVCAVGATPWTLSDCLNFGNPEVPEAFWAFERAVSGIADAATRLHLKGAPGQPVPFTTGNVSFYNESTAGRAIDPSPIICCLGVMKDYSRAITMRAKRAGSSLALVGARRDECGGSAYYSALGELGANVPKVDFDAEREGMHAVVDAIEQGLLLSCHDISDGGLAVALAEMLVSGRRPSGLGASVSLDGLGDLPPDKLLFSESGGFVLEFDPKVAGRLAKLFAGRGVKLHALGAVDSSGGLSVTVGGGELFLLSCEDMRRAWREALPRAMR